MKALMCNYCGDIFNLNWEYKQCSCGKTSGFYIDKENIVYSCNYAIVLGFHNTSLISGIINRPLDGRGYYLYSWIVPYYCSSTIKVKDSRQYVEEYKLYDGVHENWLKEIDNIREKGFFKRIIYKVFKKLIMPSLSEKDLEYMHGRNNDPLGTERSAENE